MMQAPIVGMGFRPPANDVIILLPVGTKLIIKRELDNPNDVAAVKVIIPDFNDKGPNKKTYLDMVKLIEADTYGHLRWSMENLTDPFHLGYIANSAKTGGKFASEFCSWMDPDAEYECELVYSPNGRPNVQIEQDAAPIYSNEVAEAK